MNISVGATRKGYSPVKTAGKDKEDVPSRYWTLKLRDKNRIDC
jgi:hypothetical protein